MKTQMHILNIGAGTVGEGTQTQPWSNALIVDDANVEDFDDGTRFSKGIKTAKITMITDNNFEMAKRFQKETFPASFLLDVEMKLSGGKSTLIIHDFKSNINPNKQG